MYEHDDLVDNNFPSPAKDATPSYKVAGDPQASDIPNRIWSPSIVPGQEDAKNTSKSWWDTQGLARRLGGSKKKDK